MEKETHQPESIATVTIKPEYAPSEYSASEPPPAYMKPRSSSVHIAKIIAVTVVVCSIILGTCLLASAYVTANASCRQLEQELELLSDAADRFQGPLQPEALIQEQPAASTNSKRQIEPLHAEEPTPTTKELSNHIDDDSSSSSESDSDSDSEEIVTKAPTQNRVPIQMDVDDLVSHLLEKNQKSKMNCIVEKKKAEEFVDHQPKTIRLPFGINLTTNPRFEKLTGERMVIVCESGTLQSAEPPSKPKEEEPEDEQDEETIMIQPIMIPIPHSPFETHMPQQMDPMIQRQESMGPREPMSPREPIVFREPIAPREPMVPREPIMFQQNMRLPMRPPAQIMPQMRPQMPQRIPVQPQIQIHLQPQPQQQPNEFPPNPILQHIVQQIVAQRIMREQQLKEEQEQQQQPQQQSSQTEQSQEMDERPRFVQIEQIGQGGQRLPIPEEVLTQLNRLPLPNRDVIVAVSETDNDEGSQDVQFVQEQRQSANEMNGRQTFAGRGLPVDIPVAMTPQDQESQEQEQQSADVRPHYVQPRSV